MVVQLPVTLQRHCFGFQPGSPWFTNIAHEHPCDYLEVFGSKESWTSISNALTRESWRLAALFKGGGSELD